MAEEKDSYGEAAGAAHAFLSEEANLSEREPRGANSERASILTILERGLTDRFDWVRRYLRNDHHFAPGTESVRRFLGRALR